MSRIHRLKTDPAMFDAVARGVKRFEIRRDDCGFQDGDELDLLETVHSASDMAQGAPLAYTSRSFAGRITFLLRGPAYGLPEGYVAFSFREVEA